MKLEIDLITLEIKIDEECNENVLANACLRIANGTFLQSVLKAIKEKLGEDSEEYRKFLSITHDISAEALSERAKQANQKPAMNAITSWDMMKKFP